MECSVCEEAFEFEYKYREHMAACHWGCERCCVQYLSETPAHAHREACAHKPLRRALALPKVDLKLYKYVTVGRSLDFLADPGH